MYTTLKKIAKRVFSEKVLAQNEVFLRKMIALKYAGNNYKCNICNYNLKHFVALENQDLLCPSCGSLARTRKLYQILNDLKPTEKVLHFSPSKSLSSKLKSNNTIDYYDSDFVGEFDANYHFDITAISKSDNYFNYIICFHVLEHIEDDIEAMKELYRVLKPNGLCLIQTPFKTGDIYENKNITSEDEREKAFGQKDHVRIYSPQGLKDRLSSVGFAVEIKNLETTENNLNGLKKETILFAKK